MPQNKGNKGFTLLELLIVISIIAILAVALIFVLNPAETLKKSRDVQRISDLNTLKSAVGLYLTSVNPAYLAGAASNDACKSGTGNSGGGTYASGDKIYYSLDSGTSISDTALDGGSSNTPSASQVAAANTYLTDGTGWLPVNFDAISSGSPISNLPIDPTNTMANGTSTASSVTNEALVYRYACNATNLAFEIDARLESTEYTSTDNKLTKDGGNNSKLYEVGTNLKIFGSTDDF